MYHESGGFVRRIMKGGKFLAPKKFGDESSKKSARSSKKKLFDKLEVDDDDSFSALRSNYTIYANIQQTFSTESEMGAYKRESLYEQKETVLKNQREKVFSSNDRKRELSPIKPPVKDTAEIQPLTSLIKKNRKNQNSDIDLVYDSFGFRETKDSNRSIEALSKTANHREEDSVVSKQTYPLSSYITVNSDPTIFLLKEQSTKLTMKNLAEKDAMTDSLLVESNSEKYNNEEIGNTYKESKFYQFSVDEDKASTVVESSLQLPIRYKTDEDGDQTEYSYDQTSQGTRIQQYSGAPSSGSNQNDILELSNEENFNPFFSTKDTIDGFPGFGTEKSQSFVNDFDIESRISDRNTSFPCMNNKSVGHTTKNCQREKKNTTIIRTNNCDDEFYFTNESFFHPSSTSSNTHLPPVSHFGTFASPRNNKHGITSTVVQDKINTKKNYVVKTNQTYKNEILGGTWNKMEKNKLRGYNNGNNDGDEINIKDNPALFAGIGRGIKNQNNPNKISRILVDPNDNENINPHGTFKKNDHSLLHPYKSIQQNHYGCSELDDNDKNISKTREPSCLSESYKKPLALPSNAIMASMLFRTHYDIDKNDVDEKLRVHEEEQIETRYSRGDIPDAVTADHDYITTISSFSEGTCALQDTWRKPSRDLLNNLSSARVLDMNYHSAHSTAKHSFHIKNRSHAKQNDEGLFEV